MRSPVFVFPLKRKMQVFIAMNSRKRTLLIRSHFEKYCMLIYNTI